MNTKGQLSDAVYAYSLSQALTKVAPPATIGLYSSCRTRLRLLRRSIETHVNKEAKKREQDYRAQPPPRSHQPSIQSLLNVLVKMIFYWPVWTTAHQQRKNVRYIFVEFSAWHFAGSDLLWAGLAIRLCEAFQKSFGRLVLSVYRVAQHTENVKRKVIQESVGEWRAKRVCCVPLWLVCLAVLSGVIALLGLMLVVGLPAGKPGEDGIAVVESLAIATLGLPAAGAIRFTILLGKNLMFNQDINIRKAMDSSKMSSQLGFMNEVKKEMEVLSSFIRFMEVYERRKIRVVLQITNLERCTPEKIVGVLDALNILLSDEESPFISLLAVNPRIIVKCVESAGCYHSSEDNGYAFLNRIVTLPFTVPELCDTSKLNVFKNLVRGQSDNPEDCIPDENERMEISIAETPCPKDDSSVESGSQNELQNLLSSSTSQCDKYHIDADRLEMIESVFEKAMNAICNKRSLCECIGDNSISMRRIINSVRVSATIMVAVEAELSSPDTIAAWVVLANQWPCRLSWILQCVEDDEQRAEIDQGGGIDDGKTLWEVFSESRIELHMIRKEIASLLEQDGDPELFERFLKVDFPLTIRVANKFRCFTVNLDQSIRKELAIYRGSASLKDTMKKTGHAPLPLRSVLKMDMDDVCKEIRKLNLHDSYAETIKQNKLDGEALIYSNNSEIKEVLRMSLGEWTVFSIHFLGVKPPPVSATTDSVTPLGHQLSRPLQPEGAPSLSCP
uniref:NTPase KAP family P-loop domain containing 1 n=1 Tax=Lepisosteus oculatus TaxID=7918 RepID=W5NBE9_LEPOC|nr:PREDICTED: NTPase KAP family P-loop domain-containing protein 1 [Lepisosteus oculatus]XP_015196366.1 PREDICTED: NTPase KAP family P-loop domain-containing protein 1 [Lepisosteus oculatus]XP_015196367.1 PREDICTED: NTPase KAP family P-loop domain-containing protein 1 [Lepisosteus oculatus]